MKENDVKRLFVEFYPTLSNSHDFVERLMMKIDAVEVVRRHNVVMARINRRAAAVAALAGFIVGVLFMLVLPIVDDVVSSVSIPLFGEIFIIGKNIAGVIMWIFIGGVSAISAVTVYDLVQGLLSTYGNNHLLKNHYKSC